MFTLRYRYVLILLLAAYSYIVTVFSEVYNYYGIHARVYVILFVFILITLLVWESNRLLEKPLTRIFSPNNTLRFLIFFFAAGMIASVAISVAVVLVTNALFLHQPLGTLSISLKLAFTYATRINLFLHVTNGIVVFARNYKLKQLEAEELKRVTAQSQLQAIKSQVNPHFLFNNLNVLSSLVLLENPDANKFIEAFAKVYRHILSSQQQELITLQTELDFMEPYVFLLKKRFPESIFIKLDIPEKFMSYYTLPVALQMLIENAIKHNIASKAKPLMITVTTDANNNLIVSNNLQTKIPEGESTNVGLKNIAQRYELTAGKKIDIIKTNESFSVALPLIAGKV